MTKTNKTSKIDRDRQNFESQLVNLDREHERVSNVEIASFRFMHYAMLDDIKYRRKHNLKDLLDTEIIDRLLKSLSETEPGQVQEIETYAYVYNFNIVTERKSKEIEIKDGEECLSCKSMSCIIRNVQLRAGDEGMGRVSKCTKIECGAQRVLDRG